MFSRKPVTVEEALRRQKRMLTFGGVILAAQFVNTVVLWMSTGRFPTWSGMAFLGLWIFYAMLLRQHRRLKALPPVPSAKPGKKRRRLRDPHRKSPGARTP